MSNMIVAPQPIAAEEGAKVLMNGGNAIDAAVTAGFVQGLLSPHMCDFHPHAGHPNSIAPGKGRTTGMTPTIVYRDGNPVMVIGAPGATRIITSILQVVLNVLDFGMSISDAVLAPRVDCQGDLIHCHARIPEYVCAEVRRKHPIQRLPQSHGGFALVHAITLDPESGRLEGGADTGSSGMALLV